LLFAAWEFPESKFDSRRFTHMKQPKAPKSPPVRAQQVNQPTGQIVKANGKVPAVSPETLKTSEIITALIAKNKEMESAHKAFISRGKEMLPLLEELELRFNKLPGQRNDLLDDVNFPAAMGWYAYLNSIDVNPNTYNSWKRRHEAQLEALIQATQEQVAADLNNIISPTPKPTSKKPLAARGASADS
jgi:hypothetical protein